MDDLAKKKRVKGAHQASASKFVTKIVETILRVSEENQKMDLIWLRQSQVTLRENVKRLKELDEQIIDLLSVSEDGDVEEQLSREVKTSDEVVAELEGIFIKLDDALRNSGEQSLPFLPTRDEGDLNRSHVSTSSAGRIVRTKLMCNVS